MNIRRVFPFLGGGDGEKDASSAADAGRTAESPGKSTPGIPSEGSEGVAGRGSRQENPPDGEESHVAPPELRGSGYVIGRSLKDQGLIRMPAEGRIHSLIVGKSGTGKTTYMLTQMLQDAERGDSVFVFDPQGDLAERFMSFLPEDRWEDVVYVNPITHDKYEEGVVKFNFLSFRKIRQADLETDAFMRPLHKLYEDFWGPRLAGIMRHGIDLLRDSNKDFTLFELANILSNDSEREALLRGASGHQERFWKHDFKKMPRKAPTAALTKMYKLTQSETLRPMIDTTYTTVDLYDCMQKGKIVIFDLRTSQLAEGYPEFLGSLFLARLTMLGMVRQEIPKEDRTPVHVYADEAHRFVTETIADNMRALRKYRVYFTIASQNLHEYEGRTSNELPELAETVVVFQCGRDTAENVESAFSMIGEGNRRRVSDAITNLNFYNFYMSTQVGSRKRSKEVPARTIDPGTGSTNYTDVARKSLGIYGEEPDLKRRVELKGVELSLKEFKPVEYYVLQEVCTTGKIRLDKLKSRLKDDYGIDSGQKIRQGAGKLVDRKLITETQGETKRETVKRMLFFKPTERGIRKLYPRWTPRSRGGGPDHVEMICRLVKLFRRRQCFPVPLDGEKDVKKLEKEGEWEKAGAVPDLVVFLPSRIGNDTNPDRWKDQALVAEAEAFPRGEKSGGAAGSGTKGSRTVEHFDDARELGLPVMFGVKKDDESYVREKLRDAGAKFGNVREKPLAGYAEVHAVDVGADGAEGNLKDQIKEMRKRAAEVQERQRKKEEYTYLVKGLENHIDDMRGRGASDKARKLEKMKRDLQLSSLNVEEAKQELKEMGVAIDGIKELTGEEKGPEAEAEEEEKVEASVEKAEPPSEGKTKKETGRESPEEVEKPGEKKAKNQGKREVSKTSEAKREKRTVSESEAERAAEETGTGDRSKPKTPREKSGAVELVPQKIETLEDLVAAKNQLKRLLKDSSRSEEAVDLISYLGEEYGFRRSGGSVRLRAKVTIPEEEEKKWRERSVSPPDDRVKRLFEEAGVEI